MIPWIRRQNPKFKYLYKSFRKETFTLLDIGCGNHSASKTKKVFQNCLYYGLDYRLDYNNDENDFKNMEEFYECDLTKIDFIKIPDLFFDAIIVNHVIEHLYNGELVLKALLPKLKKGGYMYIEFPSYRSLHFPSMRGTLNFYDDRSHVRIYRVEELKKLFSDCVVVDEGPRRSWFYIFAVPIRLIVEGWYANIFWDLLGFADFIYIQKNKGEAL